MPSIYVQKNSPYYWIRIYDKNEIDPSKRKKRINSKIELSLTDRKKIQIWISSGADPKKKPKIFGNEETKKLLQLLSNGLVENDVLKKTGIQIRIPIVLSEAVEEYIQGKTRLGDKKSLKPKTISAYRNAANRFIEATQKDVEVYKYLNADFSKMLAYMELNELSEPTRHSYTKHLHVLWNYFFEKGYATSNIIEVYEGSKTIKPEDIPLDEFKIILKYYEDKPEKWEWIYYLLLSMNRPSTALLQERSKINFLQKYVEMLNVKETRKNSKYYIYPLYKEFEELIKRILQRPDVDGSGRLFSHFKIGSVNFTDSFWWWYSDQKKLVLAKLISKPYQMKQIRKTLPSYALNELGFSPEELKFLLDHTDEAITQNHYLNVKYDVIRKRFEKQRIFDSSEQEEFLIYDDEPVKVDLDDAEIKRRMESIVKKSKVNIQKEELRTLLNEKIPITKIAEKYGVSDVAIHKWITKFGLKK